jgi:hypothetical protein
MVTDVPDELEAIAIALERLALEVRRLAGRQERPPQRRRRVAVEEGQRVRITIDGPYKGLVGTVTERRGSMYWYIRLDAVDGGLERVIYKMPTSFKIIAAN